MTDTRFDFDICCQGVSWDAQWGYDDDGRTVMKRYRIDTLMLRASPVMIKEWYDNRSWMEQNDFATYAEYEVYKAEKEAKRKTWKAKVCQMLGWKPEYVCITNHMSEIFAVSKIESVGVGECGGQN